MKRDLVEVELKIRTLGDLQFMAFLARLIYELTLSSRAANVYMKESAEAVAALVAINQLQHLLSAQLMKLIAGSGDRISAADLIARFFHVSELPPTVQREAATAFFAALDSVRAKYDDVVQTVAHR